MTSRYSAIFLAQLVFLIRSAAGALSGTFTSVAQAFPQLADLDTITSHITQAVGGQNFTRCCLRAVASTYEVDGGKIITSRNPANVFLDLTPDKLNESQFPCGAKYAGDDAGAPLVSVPYHWCAENCPGWQQSINSDLNQWIIPFVGFVLPAAVFCLSVSWAYPELSAFPRDLT
jgi:hypothetical protein